MAGIDGLHRYKLSFGQICSCFWPSIFFAFYLYIYDIRKLILGFLLPQICFALNYCVFNHLFSSEEFVNRFWLEELNVFILVLVFLRLIFFNSNCRQSLSFSKCVSCNRNLNLFVAKNVQYLFHGGSTWLKRWRIRSKSWIDLVFWS